MARRARTKRQADARSRALSAVADLRRGDARSLSDAARRRGTTVRSIRKYTPSAIRQQDGSRRWQARPGDTYASTMRVLTVDGVRTMRIQGSRQRQLAGQHWNAVRKFTETGEDAELARFAGVSITGTLVEHGSPGHGVGLQADLLADPDDLALMAGRGELDEVEVYALALR